MEVTYESLKVMVIDDSKTIRRTAETLLKKAGCMVITATDGFDALAKIADTRPDIIWKPMRAPTVISCSNTDWTPRTIITTGRSFPRKPVTELPIRKSLVRLKLRVIDSAETCSQFR